MDFSKLFYDLHGKEESPFVLHPDLNRYNDFDYKGELDKDKVFRYVNYLYSEETPLAKKFKDDILERKKEAAKLAEIKITKQNQDALFSLYDPGVLSMVMRFLIMQRSLIWASIVSNETVYWENTRQINEPLQGEDEKKRLEASKVKGALLGENYTIQDRLSTLYKELVRDDKELLKKLKSVDVVMCTPESIALINRRF
jgi:hypothetical protein